MTETSESDSSKQVEETWTSNTSTPQTSLSQVNTIGCQDEGLWIFSMEDSKKRRNMVKWEDQSGWKTEEHDLMIDSGCCGHVCPPWFAPQFPMVSSTIVEAAAANNVALQQYGQKGVRKRDNEQWKTNFDPCQATLEKIWTQITKLVVIKRGEALNPRVPVTYLGFEYRSVHDGDRRGFTVKPTAKYVDECLDIVQLQHAKAVMTPLTEQKSLNLHDETTACDQVQHSSFRAVVGKLQYFTGVRPDLMFATRCLSYKLAPTLADLTLAKKVLRYLKGTRELKLYLTIPALKANDLNKTLKHITGYFDADWASDEEKHISHTVLR